MVGKAAKPVQSIIQVQSDHIFHLFISFVTDYILTSSL